jgi:pimeloyl-ACP methyl ester carboxylesterase
VIAPELARRENETEADKKARWQTVISSRVPDVRFLLNHLLHRGAWNYAATIDPDHIGVVGHSFGGWTVLTLPEVDNSISAIVALAPGGNSNPRPGILPARLDFRWQRDIPTLYLVAENDVPLPLSGMYELFERTPSRKQMVILRRADHLHFIDNIEQQHEAFRTMAMPPEVSYMQKEMHPISQLVSGERAQLWVRGLALAHMDAFLKSHSEARQFLAGDLEAELASRGVEVIFYKP